MSTMTTDELAVEMTRRLAERVRVACPSLPEAVLDDLTEQFLEAFYCVADAATESERRRRRPGGWS